MLFDELLSFHKPTAPKGALYWFDHTAHLFLLDLDWSIPRYPATWSAGKYERFAISIVHKLVEQDAEISAEIISAAYLAAAS